MVERLEKRKESLLRENEKLRSDRGQRNRGTMKSREGKPPALASFIATATSGISFEEFAKDKRMENSGSTTP